MKKLTLLMVLVLLISCNESKEKQLVSNYEQRIGNTKTDLNLKFQKFEFVKDYIVKDSLDFLTKYLNEEKEMQIQHLNKKINRDEKTIQIIREGNFAEDTFKELTKDTYQQIENCKSMLILYNEDFRRTYLESTYIKIGLLKKKLDSVLCKVYYTDIG